jgi:hypothetical protein
MGSARHQPLGARHGVSLVACLTLIAVLGLGGIGGSDQRQFGPWTLQTFINSSTQSGSVRQSEQREATAPHLVMQETVLKTAQRPSLSSGTNNWASSAPDCDCVTSCANNAATARLSPVSSAALRRPSNCARSAFGGAALASLAGVAASVGCVGSEPVDPSRVAASFGASAGSPAPIGGS